jgi:hypothetical protein
MMRRLFAPLSGAFLLLAGGAGAQAVQDSLSPVFRSDSSQIEAIRKVEAGGAAKDTARSLARGDSLLTKLKRRGPYVGLSAGVAFTQHSARDLFTNQMNAEAAADSQRILQRQDPVHVFFPGGLLLGIPVTRHFDAQLRTQHFYYRVKGLAQKNNEAPSEYWYSQQAHFAGLGLRWLVPGSLLTVNGKPGLYAAYTHFWSFGPTGMRSPHGSVRARTNPAGAGHEIQLGFQQDFDKRWALTGGLSYSRLTLASKADWTNLAPTATGAGQAEWTMQSMRFAMQGIYQFGR